MKKINGNVLIIKEINLNIVRKALKELKCATKSQIAKHTDLTTATVGTILQTLSENNEIEETKKVKSNGGRPAQEFKYNFNFMNALIIYPYEKSGKTNLNIEVVNLSGECIEKENIVTNKISLDNLKSIIHNKINSFPKIKIIAFGNPGVCYKGKILYSYYKELVNCNLEQEFFDEFKIPTIVESDVNSAVIGFRKRRHSQNSNLVYLFFSEQLSLTAGLLIKGDIFRGSKNFSGSINYLNQFEWNNDIFQNFEKFSINISKIINMISCLINPSVIILSGNVINEEHIDYIKKYCKNSLLEEINPDIYLSKNFLLDYKEGLIISALETLIPDVSITRKELQRKR